MLQNMDSQREKMQATDVKFLRHRNDAIIGTAGTPFIVCEQEI
jgi:hypothetical protein